MGARMLYVLAIALLVLIALDHFDKEKPVEDKAGPALARIESKLQAIGDMGESNKRKVQELETIQVNFRSELSQLKGRVEAGENFKQLIETMVARPVQVVMRAPKVKGVPLIKRAGIIHDRPLPQLKVPELLRKSKRSK